ncbi:carbohydrate-binding protein [Flagellimonas myxillae]|uniref:carbohydrate-binding protein n=1 Tax=Flagellimonas myxillae TaxID=2942214 RepID=UPI00201F990F|nr:carbohydrate-binding protein [Muricauda myxillae]MCL6266315.1 carbohydrate-binding protein [Muricauda myxillae]
MKNRKQRNGKTILSVLVFMILLGCERDLSDEAEFATFSTTGDVFTDLPVGLGSNFYFPFLGSKATAFSVDENTAYEGQASIRIDVPNANDPNGNFAGAIFRIDGSGRNLTGFDALTFWAKASQGVNIGEIGFGQDFGENKFQVTRTNVSLGTQWAKYVIPIPDASKLIEEKGMLWYAAGTNDTGGFGYTFWLDEVRFENLGTIAQAQPSILNGEDVEQDAFIDIPITLTGLTQTFNSGSGENITVIAKPSYFDFQSTNVDVARSNELGVVSVVGTGQATITATLANVAAAGSLALDVAGTFDFAPTPPARDAGDVISVFSDAYNNVPVDYYNGFFTDGFQTTEGGAPPIDVNGDMIINYTLLNFVGIGTFNDVAPLNLTDMTHLHVDIKVNEAVDADDFIRLQLLNSVGNNETSGSVTIDSSTLVANQWVSLDIPLADFADLGDRSQIGLLFFISDGTIADIFVDNIYYYK